MKVRESGMPDKDVWQSFFNPGDILTKLGVNSSIKHIVDFGCGYGTFSIAAAKYISGNVYALDIEHSMLEQAKDQASSLNISNINFIHRDFVSDGTGLPDKSVDYAMIFNLLHIENPILLLTEAFRILIDNGQLGIIHWIHDPDTPRGPPISIRPTPEQCQHWATQTGFINIRQEVIDLAPYHFGLVFNKSRKRRLP